MYTQEMNYLLTNPVGIDKEIQAIQTYLYDNLIADWGVIDAYGRAYKNRLDLGFVPEVYKGDNEYIVPVYNDSVNSKGIMFFLENHDHSSDDGFKFKTRVKICFMLNLEKIGYTGERSDCVVQNKVASLINEHPTSQFKVTGLEKTVRNMLYGYSYTKYELETDMHPLHSFAIIGDIEYYLTEKCN